MHHASGQARPCQPVTARERPRRPDQRAHSRRSARRVGICGPARAGRRAGRSVRSRAGGVV